MQTTIDYESREELPDGLPQMAERHSRHAVTMASADLEDKLLNIKAGTADIHGQDTTRRMTLIVRSSTSSPMATALRATRVDPLVALRTD